MACWQCRFCGKHVEPPYDRRFVVAIMFEPDETTYNHRRCWLEAERARGSFHKEERRSGSDRRKEQSRGW
jgi:hypothetical protein